jgi:hypothetical protein
MAHLKSKSETAPFVDIAGEFEPGATRWCFYDNNVLGDPMMAAWTCEPGSVTASYSPLVPIGEDTIAVQINGAGICKGFTCCIYRNDTLFGAARTNNAGMAVVAVSPALTEGPVYLIVTGFNILPHFYEIEVSDYWMGWSQVWNDPTNWFTGAVPDSNTCIIIPSSPVGGSFPLKNDGIEKHCKAILIEQGAMMNLGNGECFSISGN